MTTATVTRTGAAATANSTAVAAAAAAITERRQNPRSAGGVHGGDGRGRPKEGRRGIGWGEGGSGGRSIGVCGLAEEGCRNITSTADDNVRSPYDHNMII